jgi:flavin-dependent dehydrogenase
VSRLHHEVLVLGAGPAGSIVAAGLAERGIDVGLIAPPTSRTGPERLELVSPAAVALLAELGLGDAIVGAARSRPTERRVRWFDETADTPTTGSVLVDRDRLDAGLRGRASWCGAQLHARRAGRTSRTGWTNLVASGEVEFSAAWVVEARGGAAPSGRVRLGPRRLALRAPLRGAGAPSTMLDAASDGWTWAATDSLGGSVMAVFAPPTLGGTTPADRAALLDARIISSPDLRDLRPDHAAIAVVDVTASAVRSTVEPGRITVGDAALRYDPVSGQGLAHAIRTAAQTVVAIVTLLDPTGDHQAATSFLRRRHHDDVDEHRRGLWRIYHGHADAGVFWSEHVDALAVPPPTVDGAEHGPADAVLVGDRIVSRSGAAPQGDRRGT